MITLKVTDRDDQHLNVSCEIGEPLMFGLRDQAGVEATCGGSASCGTCHIYVEESWLAALDPKDDEENMLLEGLISTRDNSRVACKLIASEQLDGVQLVLAPED